MNTSVLFVLKKKIHFVSLTELLRSLPNGLILGKTLTYSTVFCWLCRTAQLSSYFLSPTTFLIICLSISALLFISIIPMFRFAYTSYCYFIFHSETYVFHRSNELCELDLYCDKKFHVVSRLLILCIVKQLNLQHNFRTVQIEEQFYQQNPIVLICSRLFLEEWSKSCHLIGSTDVWLLEKWVSSLNVIIMTHFERM